MNPKAKKNSELIKQAKEKAKSTKTKKSREPKKTEENPKKTDGTKNSENKPIKSDDIENSENKPIKSDGTENSENNFEIEELNLEFQFLDLKYLLRPIINKIISTGVSSDKPEITKIISTGGSSDKPEITKIISAGGSSSEHKIFNRLVKEFSYLRGIGNWTTTMNINKDGSFSGTYYNLARGAYGNDHPKGTMYLSEFKGKFVNTKKVNNFEYHFDVKDLTYPPINQEHIKDGLKIITVDPSGINDSNHFILYLPGMEINETLERRLNIALNGGHEIKKGQLDKYILFNETIGTAFAAKP